MVKAIIFDLDGTLISEREYILGCLKNVGGYIDHIYGTKDAYFELACLLEIKWDRVFNRCLDKLNIPYKEEDIQKMLSLYRDATPVTKLYPDVVETLERFKNKGIKLILLTNGYYEVQKKKIEIADLGRYFDLIIIPDEKGREYWKPSLWAYKKILNYFQIEPGEVMVVGDIDNDFIAPMELGMKTVYINREDRMKDLSSDICLDKNIISLKEIEMEV